MVGDTGGIVTDYKKVTDGKREIPISSCPSFVEDLVYGTGTTLIPQSDDEIVAFEAMVQKLDERAAKFSKPKPNEMAPRYSKRYKKIQAIRKYIGDFDFYVVPVDTDNRFVLLGKTYELDVGKCAQYAPRFIKTHDGDDTLYDMDKVNCFVQRGHVYFYDMNMDKIDDDAVCVMD